MSKAKRVVPVLLVLAINTAAAQSSWQFTGIPALNFNSDEGFGSGAVVQAFNYGAVPSEGYRYTIQPTAFFTTKGRRDLSVFFDAPHLLPNGWRVGAYVAREQQLAAPYYGIGNATQFDASKQLAPNPYYYRFGRDAYRATANLQRPIGGAVRLLIGAGVRATTIDQTPFDSGTTLLRSETRGAQLERGRLVYGRLGMVYDTRDRETGPTRGQWSELLVQRGIRALGGNQEFTRATGTVRTYLPLAPRLTLASRVIGEQSWGTIPFYEISVIQGSFKDDDGLGGAATLRGWPKDRFIGKSLALTNQELRWRATEFQLRGREAELIASTFVDAGRVFDGGGSWHASYGGGLRLQYGRDFVIATDVGHSRESNAAVYIGLGYLF